MPLLQVAIALIAVCVLLWVINRRAAMQRSTKSALNAVVIIAAILWLFTSFGLFHSLPLSTSAIEKK